MTHWSSTLLRPALPPPRLLGPLVLVLGPLVLVLGPLVLVLGAQVLVLGPLVLVLRPPVLVLGALLVGLGPLALVLFVRSLLGWSACEDKSEVARSFSGQVFKFGKKFSIINHFPSS